MRRKRLNKKRFFTVMIVFIATIALIVAFINRDQIFSARENQDKAPVETQSPLEPPSETPETPGATETPATPDPPEDIVTSPSPEETQEPTNPLFIRTDYEAFSPNELGDIPIIMFHRFIEAYEEKTEKDYTTTFGEFEQLLQTLYDANYRLISMKDFIDSNISVPAGTTPMVFTFDDGTPGQFSLIEKDSQLVVNPDSAVGIMMKFNEKHPDFGLKGIFYVNMDIGDNTFSGAGSLQERFDILRGLGLEIGNHTWGHVKYSDPKNNSAEVIQTSVGKNQEKAYEVISDLSFYSLALPYGSIPETKSLDVYFEKGTYNGTEYENKTIMAVGANPTPPSIHKGFNNRYVARIRAQGRVAVDGDLTWWLPRMTASRMFISDGDPDTIVIPEVKADKIIEEKLNGKTLITY